MITLTINKKGPVQIIHINRPPVNALNKQVIDELLFVLTRLKKDVRVVILTGTGKAFTAGVDINMMSTFTPAQARTFARQAHALIKKILTTPKIIISAVNGFALGAGTEIIAASDITIASKNATFGQPEVKLGIIPGMGGTQLLRRIVGAPKAKELILRGHPITADEAHRIGLVNRVVLQRYVLSAAVPLAEEIAQNSPHALATAKKAINTSLNLALDNEAKAFVSCFSQDQKEGMKAFLEKRKPRW